MKLIVCLEGQNAGLVEGDGSTARFTYADTWLNRPGAYPLSYSMPLRSAPFTGRTVLNFLWGLLPDNERTLSTWSRWFQVSARNPLALLSHVGEDCAGAVQFVLEERLDQIMEQSSKATEVEWLEDRELERRLQRLIQDGTAGRTADEGQFSLAGAQPKIALYLDPRGDRWGVPRGRTPTTHILKPVANDFDGFAENEHFCMTLARRVGLAAASTEWRTIGGVPTLIHQLALACNYASERLLGTLKELARQLPDEAAALAKDVGGPTAPDSILPGLLTALAAQCRRALSA